MLTSEITEPQSKQENKNKAITHRYKISRDTVHSESILFFTFSYVASERLQILFKWFNLDSYYPRPDSMYNCALSQSSHVDCQTLICVNPCQTWIRFRLIELVSMHLIMLMRLEPREVW